MICWSHQAGADAKSISKDGMNALHFAILKGEQLSVQFLLEAGVDVHYPAKDTSTPLVNSDFERNTMLLFLPLTPSPPVVIIVRFFSSWFIFVTGFMYSERRHRVCKTAFEA